MFYFYANIYSSVPECGELTMPLCFSENDGPSLSYLAGDDGTVSRRTFLLNPTCSLPQSAYLLGQIIHGGGRPCTGRHGAMCFLEAIVLLVV